MSRTLIGASPVRGALHAIVSRNVLLLLHLRGLSRKDLYVPMGWQRGDLSRHLRGASAWSLHDVERVARVLDVHPSALLVDLGDHSLTAEDGVVRARLPA